jgi:hypothetical protein
MMKTLTRQFAIACALGSLGLWVLLLFFNPYSSNRIEPGTYMIGFLMITLALAGAWATPRAHLPMMFAAGLLSFLPIGLYTMGTPGIFKWIGVLNLLYLVAAVAVSLQRLLKKSAPIP